MTFQIMPLRYDDFAHLFDLSDAELALRNARRQIVTSSPGTPCRVSLEDAAPGETVMLVNYLHQPGPGPFTARHAIYVRRNAREACVAPGAVPRMIRSRLISLRLFDADHMMIDADAVPGDDAAAAIRSAFANSEVAYGHIHFARQGCFAASVHPRREACG
ncbi:MAG: DUF1203 domain-containing protein [Rhodobacteraceae bacterium]|nr:DUF1203 domain-containing protein [Paracoccaceae bacterium]